MSKEPLHLSDHFDDFQDFRPQTPFINVSKTLIEYLIYRFLVLFFKIMVLLIEKLQELLPRSKIDIFGKQNLMDSCIPYYLLTGLSIAALLIDRPNPYLLIFVAYAGLGFLDEIFSLDTRNPSKQERIELEKDGAYYRFPLYTTIIFSWALFFKNLRMWSTMEITMETLPFIIGLALVAANYYTAQFVLSHELMHKPGKFYKLLGTLHTSKFFYMHFVHHHIHRHHVWVGTPLDPSHTRKGQNVYRYVVRSVVDSWKGVFEDQKSAGKSIFGNMAVLSLISTLVFASGILYFYGTQALVIHLLMVIFTIFYLQATGYIEHYGLQRKKIENGEYEKVNIYHSWNAPHRFTNYIFFKVQRHSDHHENSSKPYQTLALPQMNDSPFLPHGYILMVVMTFFPKIWFKVMDPLVDQYRKLTPENHIGINTKVIENSITETRKFLINLSFALLFIMTISFIYGM